MGLRNRKRNRAPRAARAQRSKAQRSRSPQGRKGGLFREAGRRVRRSTEQVLDAYSGGAYSTLTASGKPMRTRRRMNVANAKAARRAASRVKGTIRMLERLKASLPKVTSKGRVTAPKRKR